MADLTSPASGTAAPATPPAPATVPGGQAPATTPPVPPAAAAAKPGDAPAVDVTALAAAVAQALAPMLRQPAAQPASAPAPASTPAPAAADEGEQRRTLETRLAEERRGRERAEREATEALIRLHVGGLKQPAYISLAPKVERGPEGQLTDESRAKLDAWKAASGELFVLAPATTTPAGAPQTGSGPTFSPAALAWQRARAVDPAKLADRPGAGMLVPLLGHNSRDLSLADLAARGGGIGGAA